MGDRGQIILLSALVACLCLFGVIACVSAVDDGVYTDDARFSDHAENVQWARDYALQRAAFHNSAYQWDSRAEAALRFKADANSSIDSLAGELLKHGVVYMFSFNDSLGGDYAASHPGNGTVDIDGVLVEPVGGSTRIFGCAFDVFAYDGIATYRASRVLTFD